MVMAAQVDKKKCTGCGDCVEVCPSEAIRLEDEKAVVDEGECVDCGACEDECMNDAISIP